MKKMVWLTMMVLGITSCQMENEPVNTPNKMEGTEIVLSGKSVNSADELWKISVKGENMSYVFDKTSGTARLTQDQVEEMEEMLESCRANKIKTKAVSKNDKEEWMSVFISCSDFRVQCVESFNYKLTKKSRKKVKSIRTRLLEIVHLKADEKTGELALLAHK